MSSDAVDRYRRAIETGSREDLAAFAATGRAGLLILRDDLGGRLRPDIDAGVHPRDQVDHLTQAVAAIADAGPDDFLEVFAGDAWDGNSFVLTGLGRIDDPRATDRLVRAASSRSQWIRMGAAIGLRHRTSPAASATLVRLLSDREYLVRYHALESLAMVGVADDLPALRGFAPHAPIEEQLATRAIAAIEARVSGT